MKYLLSILCLFMFSCDETAHIFGVSDSNHNHYPCEDGSEFTASGYYCDDWAFIEDLYDCTGDECTGAYVSNMNSYFFDDSYNYINWFDGRIVSISIYNMDFESIPKTIGNLDYLFSLTL